MHNQILNHSRETGFKGYEIPLTLRRRYNSTGRPRTSSRHSNVKKIETTSNTVFNKRSILKSKDNESNFTIIYSS